MVEIKTFIYIILAILAVGGSVVGFFTMQTRQNMRIKQLETEVEELKRKQSLNTSHQIDTEKSIEVINTKLDHLIQVIDELKKSIDRRP